MANRLKDENLSYLVAIKSKMKKKKFEEFNRF